MDAELPYDETFWGTDLRLDDAHIPGPGTVRPDALLVELGPAPETAGGTETDARLAEMYRALSETGPAAP